MSVNPDHWFRVRRMIGYPISWKGWALLGSAVFIEGVFFYLNLKFGFLAHHPIRFLVLLMIPILVFVGIFRRKAVRS